MDDHRNGRRTRGSRGLRWVLVGLAACIVAVILAVLLAPAVIRAVYAGHVLDDAQVAHRHASVRWVWRSGKELGWMMGVIPHIRRVYVKEVAAGNGCVHVWGGAPGCIFGTSTRHVVTLDVETGREGSGDPAGRKAEYVNLEWDGRRWTGTWAGLTWIVAGEARELRVARAEQPAGVSVPLLAVPGEADLGVSLYGLRFGDGTLVLATFEGYVLCIDLGAVERALGSLDARP
jgi:hypothetical protein